MPPRARAARVATIAAETKAKIKEAHEAGRASEKYASSESRDIAVDGNKLTLLLPDGRLTLYGAYFYRELLQLEPPKLYSYEAELIQDKWVTGFSGKKSLLGAEVPTVNGSPRDRASSFLNMPAMSTVFQ